MGQVWVLKNPPRTLHIAISNRLIAVAANFEISTSSPLVVTNSSSTSPKGMYISVGDIFV